MRVFIDIGIGKLELKMLNRVHIHEQVLFLSCVLGALGKNLDAKYLAHCPDGEHWSKINFPKECPPYTIPCKITCHQVF